MKKLILLIALLFVISCEKDEPCECLKQTYEIIDALTTNEDGDVYFIKIPKPIDQEIVKCQEEKYTYISEGFYSEIICD